MPTNLTIHRTTYQCFVDEENRIDDDVESHEDGKFCGAAAADSTSRYSEPFRHQQQHQQEDEDADGLKDFTLTVKHPKSLVVHKKSSSASSLI